MSQPAAWESAWGIPDLLPLRLLEVEPCDYRVPGGRLNLLIPAILDRWMFGGIATVLRLFETLSGHFEYSRIVVLWPNESQFDFDAWPGWVPDRGELAPRSVACLGAGTTSLQVTAADYFLAKSWSTAVLAAEIVTRQRRLFPAASRRFAYVIQDYEPGFYPWSARHVYAKSVCSNRDGILAIFNSRLLAEYFGRIGLSFSEQHVFEPLLHPVLRQFRLQADQPKERTLLVYGRPSTPRNDFDLVVEALRLWAANFPEAPHWNVLSAGEPHDEVDLGNKVILRSLGKLTMQQYAQHLSRCWTGLSLMFSPHPSYPPLEMAEFGAWVVTNRFENKTFAELAPNLIGVAEPTPAAIAERLVWCCEQYRPGRTAVIDGLGPVFKAQGDEFPFARALAASWRSP